MSDTTPLRVFVAMPGTDMGANATYKNPEAIKANLLQPVVDRLKARLGREVTLTIEKDKRAPGPIHPSMFAEARDADVYIADLTGRNANVYLELGVRWALRDRVTVLIAQSVTDLPFNVSGNRAIPYNPETLIKATEDIVEAIVDGLRNAGPDNPVRLGASYVTVAKADLDALEAEIGRLQRARGEDLLRAADAANQPAERIAILRQATEANPASVDAFLALGRAYRDAGDYPPAVDTLRHALRLAPGDAVLHRELGVTYAKQGDPASAVGMLRDAVRLDPKDVEAWSNLGGALRRVGMAHAPQSYDKDALLESRDSYEHAHALDRYALYAALNVARLDILLSRWEPERARRAKEGFSKQVHLCRFEVQGQPDDYWRRFDLADALLFSGDLAGAHAEFDQAFEKVPAGKRRDVVGSVLGPLRNYLVADVLGEPLRTEVEQIVARLARALPDR